MTKPRKTARKAPTRKPTPRPSAAATIARRGGGPATFKLTDREIEESLRTGQNEALLREHFGDGAYEELRGMAREAATRSLRGGPRVLILPGIMGSLLGTPGLLGIDDVLWLDPIDIAAGRLVALKLDGTTSRYRAVGVIAFAYLKLKLYLKIHGLDADFHPFDWRLAIDGLGDDLAERLKKEGNGPVHLVAHSMGGLVARAALLRKPKNVGKLIMLGTPNYGSFAPVQALRGTYDVVHKLAGVDLKHSIDDLASVFASFPGLYDLLPAPDRFDTVNLYDLGTWPAGRPRPRADELAAARPVLGKLAKSDERFYLIAGVNQKTTVSARVLNGEFRYTETPDGDGTVPLAFARLDGIPDERVYYVEESHGSLPNNGSVERAVRDLIATGETTALTTERPASRGESREVGESDTRAVPFEGRRGRAVVAADVRHLLDPIVAPEDRGPAAVRIEAAAAAAAGGAGATGAFETGVSPLHDLVVGRRRQTRLEVRLAFGSITAVDARAYVIGVFKDVATSGAARAIDQVIDGAITEFRERRMFSGQVGEVFIVPSGNHPLRADMVLLSGLGEFGQFNQEVQQLVAENVMRVLARSRVEEIATVLIGAGSGLPIGALMHNLLTGMFRGLKDADPRRRFRSVTLCELDRGRFAEIREAIYRLASGPLFEEVELTLDEIELPAPAEPAAAVRGGARGPDAIYLMVQLEGDGSGAVQRFRSSVLGAGTKAAVVTSVKEVPRTELDRLLGRLDGAVNAGNLAPLDKLGEEFGNLMLNPDVQAMLATQQERHVVVVHDGAASRVPWETLRIGSWTPAVAAGLSHRFLADDLPIARFLARNRQEETLRLLLVVDPSGNLEGAVAEGKDVHALAAANPAFRIDELRGKEATRDRIRSRLTSGQYDILHYAGHAGFDATNPGLSGLLCSDGQTLTSDDLAGSGSLPSLVFFNACESARVRAARGGPAKGKPKKQPRRKAIPRVSLAEGILRGGVANFLGTYWSVGDDPAMTFATVFYTELLQGSPLGTAVLAARKQVHDQLKSVDWADHILYGSYDFVLKLPPRS